MPQEDRAPASWSGAIATLLDGTDLEPSQAAWAMGEIMDGLATPAQVAGFAVALRAKGESAAEVSALVDVMLARSRPVEVTGPVVDTCGTGGDRARTVNISTMAALVVAGAGVRVVKHGNRAASSSCGSADVLEALGVAIDLEPDAAARCAEEAGITFCFAPVFHPALRHAAIPRREIGVATVFNFLGPLCNPARPSAQAVGVFDARMARVVADVFALRGTTALVFRGDDGLDELTTATTSRVWEVRGGQVTESSVDPVALGVAHSDAAALLGGDAERNAGAVRRFVAGAAGPVRDAVLLNAAAGLVAADPAGDGPLADRLGAAMARAGRCVDEGAAAAVLERWIATSRELKAAPA